MGTCRRGAAFERITSPGSCAAVWISSNLAATLILSQPSSVLLRTDRPDVPCFLNIPGGESLMGQDDGRDDEIPIHLVRISPFALAETQVTNAQYDRFCAATGHAPAKFRAAKEFWHPAQPVVVPSWFAWVAYCE